MLLLRLSLVYLLSCSVAIWIVHRRVVALSFAARAFLVLAPLLVTGGAFFTGGVYAPIDIAYQAPPLSAMRSEAGIAASAQTPILGDVVTQEIPWRKATREAVRNGRLPLWDRFSLAGEPLLAMQQPAVAHPATWIGMLLPLASAWTFEMTLRIFLALLCAYAWLRDQSLPPLACAVGAACWGFSDHVLVWLGYPLAAAIAPFPLLLLGLRRIARDRNRAACGITVVALLLIVTAGHSETLLHAVAAAGIWFLYCIAAEMQGGDPRGRARAVLLALAAGAIALGLTAFLLLPHLEALPLTLEWAFRAAWFAHTRKSVPLAEGLETLRQAILPYALGADLTKLAGVCSGYVGSIFLPFAFVGLFSARRGKRILVALGALGIAMWMRLPGIADAVGALPLFDVALNGRLVFLVAVAAAGLAALGVEVLLLGRGRWILAAAAAGTLAVIALLFAIVRPGILASGFTEPDLRTRFLLQVIPLLLVLLLALAASIRREGGPGLARWMLPVLLAAALVQRGAEIAPYYPVAPAKAFYPRIPILDAIPRGQPYRMTAVGFTFIPNVSAMYELEDARGYEAMTFRPLFETYPLWCLHQAVWFNRVDDATKPFLSFLGVRYVLGAAEWAPPAGWRVLARSPGGIVAENPSALPRAFVPEGVLVDPNPARHLAVLPAITDFRKYGVVAAFPGILPNGFLHNPHAEVSIEAYDGGRMALDVRADAPALIATSVTGWPGWNLEIDGRRARLERYNNAFLAFAVPAGRHRVTLSYMPRSFVIGVAIALVTALGLAGESALRRRAASRARPRLSST